MARPHVRAERPRTRSNANYLDGKVYVQPTRIHLPCGPVGYEPIPIVVPRLEPDGVTLNEPPQRRRVVAVADMRLAIPETA